MFLQFIICSCFTCCHDIFVWSKGLDKVEDLYYSSIYYGALTWEVNPGNDAMFLAYNITVLFFLQRVAFVDWRSPLIWGTEQERSSLVPLVVALVVTEKIAMVMSVLWFFQQGIKLFNFSFCFNFLDDIFY